MSVIFDILPVFFIQYLYLLENVDFTLFFAIYLLIYSIFTPILSQYFQFGYFFFFLFFGHSEEDVFALALLIYDE